MDIETVKLELRCIEAEFMNAKEKFPMFNSAHEGYAVLLEEVDELFDAIKMKQTDATRISRIYQEAKQVAAMALELMIHTSSEKIWE